MTGQKLIATGQFSLYEQPGGSALLQWHDELAGQHRAGAAADADADGEQQIPAEVWKLLKAVMAGQRIGPQAAVRLLAGGRNVRRGLE